jgi:hypothetical protein
MHVRRTLSTLLAGLLLLGTSGLVQSGSKDDARAVVTKAIEAMGGEAALAKHQAITFKETGTYYGMGDGLPFTGKYASQPPDKFRMEIEGVFTIVFNGDKGWTSAGGEVKEMTKDELAVQRTNNRAGYIATVLPLKDKAFTLTMLKPAKVDGKEAVGIKVARKDYPEVKLYFDAKTNLLVKSEYATKSAEQGNKDVTAEMYFSKYQKIDGVQTPTHVVLKHDGKLYVEADVQDTKAFGKLDDSVFAKP